MKKLYIYSFLFFLLPFVTTIAQSSAVGVFPYVNDLKGTSLNDVAVQANGNVKFTTDGIMLTPAEGRKKGTVILDGVSFTSDNGIVVEVEFEMYGGNKDAAGISFGDGMSFFLYDANSPTSWAIGADGAGLGYSSNRSTDNNGFSKKLGLNKGYLGIGLDQYGNFKRRRFDATSRINGIVENWATNGISHVTLRGAVKPNGLATISGNSTERMERYAGYPVLATKSTIAAAGQLGKVLNLVTNSSTSVTYTSDNSPISSRFELRGGVKNAEVGSVGYRKAILELIPVAAAAGGGYRINVKIVHGTQVVEVIKNFHYKESFYYLENANSGGNLQESQAPDQRVLLDARAPLEFKIGFSASTGESSQVHLIKNLKITLPYHPLVKEDVSSMCLSLSNKVDLDVFSNDLFYNGALENPSASNTKEYIDYDTFHFVNEKAEYLHMSTYTQPNVGTWSYNAVTAVVSFVPISSFLGEAVIYYNAKGTASLGGPFNQDKYRSAATKITVRVEKCGGLVNPQVPSR